MAKSEAEVRDAITKRNKYLWILFLSFGGLVYITSYCFPDVVLTYNKTMPTCPQKIFDHLGYDCADFNSKKEHMVGIEVGSFGPDNIQGKLKFMLVYKDDFKPKKVRNGISVTPVNFQENVYVVDDDDNIISIVREKNTNESPYGCTVKNQKFDECSVATMTDLVPKTQGRLILVLKLEKGYELQQNFGVQEVRFAFQTLNASFLKFISSFKWILFIIAIIRFFSFKGDKALLPKEFCSYESHLITFAGFILIIFNQPFLSYTNTLNWNLERSYKIKACISIIIMQLQSSMVIYFWLYLLQKLSSKKKTVSLTSKLLIKFFLLLHMAASFFVYYIFTIHQYEGGMTDLDTETSGMVPYCRGYLYIVTTVLIAWSAFKILKIIPQIKDLDWRDTISFTFSFCLALCYFYFTGTGSFQTMNLKGPRVALLYGITTLYIVLLQSVYKPFEFEVEEAKEKYKYANPQTKNLYQNLDESGDEVDPREMQNMARPTDDDESRS